jgi:hypothetical protein
MHVFVSTWRCWIVVVGLESLERFGASGQVEQFFEVDLKASSVFGIGLYDEFEEGNRRIYRQAVLSAIT